MKCNNNMNFINFVKLLILSSKSGLNMRLLHSLPRLCAMQQTSPIIAGL